MKEYDFEKNIGFDLNSLTAGCNTRVWWKCEKCNNSWCATIASRNDKNKEHGCPYCSGRFVIEGKTDLLSQYPLIAEEWDYDKNTFLPNSISKFSSQKVWWKCKNCVVFRRLDSTTSESLNKVIINVLNYLNANDIAVDTESDSAKILEQYASKKYNNSLLAVYPEVAAEWHPTKNGNLTPEQVNKSARLKVWWLGKCGHEWYMAVQDRTIKLGIRADGKRKKGYNCPYCSGKKNIRRF